MKNKSESAAKLLFLAVESHIPETSDIVFLRAAYSEELSHFGEAKNWQMEQSFAPYADQLRETGYKVEPSLMLSISSREAVLILATRFAEENQSLLARAFEVLKPSGWLAIAQHNDLGAKRLDGLVKSLGGGKITTLTKHHCRAVICQKTSNYNKTLAAEWKTKVKPVTVPGTSLLAAPGMFSWRQVDKGSALLMEHLPKNLSGKGADIAAGWGYLSWRLLGSCPNIQSISLYEAEKQALDLAENALRKEKASFYWCDAARPLPGIPAGGFDWAVTNPPAHDLLWNAPEVTASLFKQVAAALKPGGILYMVAGRQLPYEALLEKLFKTLVKRYENADYKIIEAIK